MTTYAQILCTLAELDEDLNLRGSERESKVYDKLLAASKLLTNYIGWFLPVTLTRVMGAPRVSTKLFIPPLLGGTPTIINNGTTLTAADYLLRPDNRHWENGPFSVIEVAPSAANLSAWDTDEDGVSIASQFGLYDYAEDLGVSLGASMTDSDALMKVSNGSLVSPGMVVKIESEQILIKTTSSTPEAATTLNGALAAAADVAVLTDDTKVKVGEIIRVELEQIKVLDINATTHQAYLARGWNKTKAQAHNTLSAVEVYRTFNVTRAVNGTTVAAHSNSTAISRQMIPEDINFLARKVAGRMLKDAQSGFTGRVGDDTGGQAIYTYILPHELDAVADRYAIPRSA